MVLSNDYYYEVPNLAKNLGHKSGSDVLGNFTLTTADYRNGKDFIQSNSDNDVTATLQTDRSMKFVSAENGYSGVISTYGVPCFIPGPYGETIMNVVFDAVLGDSIIGVNGRFADATGYNIPDQMGTTFAMGFHGGLSKVLINIDESDSPHTTRGCWYGVADGGDLVNLYVSNEITSYSKTARNTYAFKIIVSKGSVTGVRIIFMINNTLQDVCNLVVDAGLDVLETGMMMPFIWFTPDSYVTGVKLYQYSVQRS